MDKICSPEEIESKRLVAIQRRQQAQLKAQNVSISSQEQKELKENVKQNRKSNRFNPIEPKKFFSQKPNITVKCYMIDNDRFAIEMSSFVPEIIHISKTIQTRRYDAKNRIWSFHINDYDNLIQKFISYTSHISVIRIPGIILQIFKKNLQSDNNTSKIDLSQIDKALIDNLLPFQRDGICYGISKGGRCMIADEMGLGKTIQALGIAHYFRSNWPLLIVVPSSVRYQWSQAIYEFLPSVPAHYVHHFANGRDCVEDEKITIITYDLLKRAIKTIKKHMYGFVILDESHVVKSSKTERFQAVQMICAHARHVLLLSGTPALSRPIELYSQISLIVPRFMSYEDYGIRYCYGQNTMFGWDFTGSSNMQELQLLLTVTCMIRRLKADVLNQLPSKIRKVIILDPVLIKAGTNQMLEMSNKVQKSTTGIDRHNALVQYFNESSFARIKAVCNYVTTLFENKTKCLLYAHHRNVLDAICVVAESMNIRYIRIDGKTNPEQRKQQVDKFQERDDYLAAVLSITAANAGITLTAARLVVFTELFWNPGILVQAEDRVHRIGQNDNVIIQYLVAKDTADDHMWPLIRKKIKVLNEAGLDQDFSIDDVKDVSQKDSKQGHLITFVNNLSFEERSNKEQKDCSVLENVASTSTSSNEFKELLEVDAEFFDFCEWDDMV